MIVQWARSSRRGPSQVKIFLFFYFFIFLFYYKGGNNRSNNNLTCYNCSRPGHISRNCRESRGGGGGGDRNGGDRGGGDRGGGDRRNTNNYDRRGDRGNYRRRVP